MDKHGDFPYLCWFTRGYLYDKQEIRTHHKKMKQWHTMKDNEPESSNMASLKPTSTWIYLKGSWRYAQLPQWLQIHSAKTLCDALPRIDVFQHALPAACLIQESENPNCQTSDFSGELEIYIYISFIYIPLLGGICFATYDTKSSIQILCHKLRTFPPYLNYSSEVQYHPFCVTLSPAQHVNRLNVNNMSVLQPAFKWLTLC